MDETPDLRSLTEEKAAQLLDHAAKLDARDGSRMTVDELRQVALEAGISPEAFERALAEVQEGGPTAPVVTVGRVSDVSAAAGSGSESLLSKLFQRTGIFLTGAALAFLSSTLISDIGMDDEPVVIFSLVVAALIVAWSAVTKRRERKVLDFEVDLGVLWLAMTFFYMLVNPGDAGDVMEIMMPAGFLASLVGGMVVATGPGDPEPEQLPESV